jgi:hypothetical protein
LSGNIPNFNSPSLGRLDCSNNQLSGTIPNFNMPILNQLTLNNNQLSGTIPNFNLPELINLKLQSNQLSGTIPNFNLPKLESLILSQNKLDSCPRLTNLSALKPVNGLKIDTNHLMFDDIIPNMGFATSAAFIYTPQDSFFVDTTIIGNTGTSLSINLKIDGALTTNQYKWFKNGVLQSAYNSTNNKLIINSLQAK